MRERRVSVHDEVALAKQEPVDRVGQVASYLQHSRFVRLVNNTRELDATTRQVDDEEYVEANQSRDRNGLDSEEVHGRDGAPVRPQEGAPRCALASLGRGIDRPLSPQRGARVTIAPPGFATRRHRTLASLSPYRVRSLARLRAFAEVLEQFDPGAGVAADAFVRVLARELVEGGAVAASRGGAGAVEAHTVVVTSLGADFGERDARGHVGVVARHVEIRRQHAAREPQRQTAGARAPLSKTFRAPASPSRRARCRTSLACS